jgi:ribosomal protein S18 acetylase RimI-like enzyme
VLVAVDPAGAVLGSVTYARHGSPLAEISSPQEAEFRMLGVDPSAQGRGAGRALVSGCLALARRDGARRLVLSTQARSTVAHRLYEQLGFTRSPDRDWAPAPGVDLMVYTLEMGGSFPPAVP